jgi:hypothetical protein
MKKLNPLALAGFLILAGCSQSPSHTDASQDLSRPDAKKQIVSSPEVLVGASEFMKVAGKGETRHIGSVVNLDIMDVFIDGPRARVKFVYEIQLDKAQDAALFPVYNFDAPHPNRVSRVWIGDENPRLFEKLPSGNFEDFGVAYFEKTDNGWSMRKISMDATD